MRVRSGHFVIGIAYSTHTNLGGEGRGPPRMTLPRHHTELTLHSSCVSQPLHTVRSAIDFEDCMLASKSRPSRNYGKYASMQMKTSITHQPEPYSLPVITPAAAARMSCQVDHTLSNAHRPWQSARRRGMVYDRRSFEIERSSASQEDGLVICGEESIYTSIVIHISSHLS
jgi:hypothetical protein